MKEGAQTEDWSASRAGLMIGRRQRSCHSVTAHPKLTEKKSAGENEAVSFSGRLVLPPSRPN